MSENCSFSFCQDNLENGIVKIHKKYNALSFQDKLNIVNSVRDWCDAQFKEIANSAIIIKIDTDDKPNGQ